MRDVNKVILVGRLGTDVAKREGKNGSSFCTFSLATTSRKKSEIESEKLEETTTWHSVSVFGKEAENCILYLKKGNTVFVEGTLQKRFYNDKDGNKRTAVSVSADRVNFISMRKRSEEEGTEVAVNIEGVSGMEAPSAEAIAS
ncbi:MAG: single-stranded DNA-binding protein [Bdellovibrionota bacterium]